ncbi:hypothetical protein AB0C52_12585 [Streptomyces sp. NPDC048717]|uniref:hypothetical protein n=1 Tax=Streptomyces sp. NPDC048717 TaxID=3154928 RepID=UPI003428C218
MTAITEIDAMLQTADLEGAGTAQLVYLGIAGREFVLDTADPADQDTGRGVTRHFLLGEKSNVVNPDDNDPRRPQLDTDDLDRYPVYIRINPDYSDPQAGWIVERVNVTVNPDAQVTHYFDQPRLINTAEDRRIKLGGRMGTVVYLKRNDDDV